MPLVDIADQTDVFIVAKFIGFQLDETVAFIVAEFIKFIAGDLPGFTEAEFIDGEITIPAMASMGAIIGTADMTGTIYRFA